VSSVKAAGSGLRATFDALCWRCAVPPPNPCHDRDSDKCKGTLGQAGNGLCALPHISCRVVTIPSTLKLPTACMWCPKTLSHDPVLSYWIYGIKTYY